MNMFARFDENPAMTLQDIKETKRYGRTDGCTHGRTHARTHGQRENSIPTTNKVCGGYNKKTPQTREPRSQPFPSRWRQASMTDKKGLMSGLSLSLRPGPPSCMLSNQAPIPQWKSDAIAVTESDAYRHRSAIEEETKAIFFLFEH